MAFSQRLELVRRLGPDAIGLVVTVRLWPKSVSSHRRSRSVRFSAEFLLCLGRDIRAVSRLLHRRSRARSHRSFNIGVELVCPISRQGHWKEPTLTNCV